MKSPSATTNVLALDAGAISPFALSAAALVPAVMCGARAWREFELDVAIRSGACGGAFESSFALGQCWHCSTAAALVLVMLMVALARQGIRVSGLQT